MLEQATRQVVFLENPFHRFQEVFRRHVHDGQIFVVKPAMGLGALTVSGHKMLEHAQMSAHMPIEIHAHEAGELHKPWIDPPAEAWIGGRHGLNQHLLEPAPTM